MGWEKYLDELESEFDRRMAATALAQAHDLAKIEAAAVTLDQRLRWRIGSEVTIKVRCGQQFHVRLIRVGAQWVCGQHNVETVLIPIGAITLVRGLGRVQHEVSLVDRSLSFSAALRRLVAQRVVLTMQDGAIYQGILVCVWRDHLDLRTSAGDICLRLSELDCVASGSSR